MLHIHNGDVTASLARRAGIDGEHLPFRESLACGPVPAGVELETRARHLAEAHGQNLLRVRNDLLEQEASLAAAMSHDEIVLWFEHDLFCLANLLSLLQRFAKHPRLSLIWTREPIATRDEAELVTLFNSRAAVTPAMLEVADEGWRAYTSSDPLVLDAFVSRESYGFPFLRDGLTLHASRFPSLRNGLGAIANRALTLIAAGITDFSSIFGRLDGEHPRFGFGDSEILRELRTLSWCAVPLLTVTETTEAGPPKVLFALTPVAMSVIGGTADFITLNEPDYWLGGAHVSKGIQWRWDETNQKLVASRSAAS